MTTSYDAIVIGSGQAGPFLAVKLAQAGMKTALIEREHLGGTCVNDGCIPTKTLVASARAAHVARNAAAFGVNIDGAINIDMPRVKSRKDAIVAESTRNVERWLRGTANLTVIEGQGRFEAPHVVSVGGRRLTAPEIFINTGGRPTIPAIGGLDDIEYLTSTGMMSIDFLATTLIIVVSPGTGVLFTMATGLSRGSRAIRA